MSFIQDTFIVGKEYSPNKIMERIKKKKVLLKKEFLFWKEVSTILAWRLKYAAGCYDWTQVKALECIKIILQPSSTHWVRDVHSLVCCLLRSIVSTCSFYYFGHCDAGHSDYLFSILLFFLWRAVDDTALVSLLISGS